MSNILVDDLPLDLSKNKKSFKKAIFDSGTTFVYFNHKIFYSLQNMIKKFCKRDEQNCGGYDKYLPCYEIKGNRYDFIKSFPNIKIEFNGLENTRVNWSPFDYFSQDNNSKKKLCISVKPFKENLLGAVFMRNYDVFFNLRKQEISLIRAKCSQNEFLSTFQDSAKPMTNFPRFYFWIFSAQILVLFYLFKQNRKKDRNIIPSSIKISS